MRVYFLGICGAAMGNAALLLKSLGHEVSGSDENVYPPMSDVLAEAGVSVRRGFDAGELASAEPELVVVGNAVSRGNPEVEWLLSEKRFPMTSLPELVSRFLLSGRNPIVVAGTHGKTTTSALAAHLLRETGVSPGYFIGGVPRGFARGAETGAEGAPFVIEGDEYDSAFFDKRSKFIHYRPHILVVNNIEFDHADIFRDLDDVRRTFAHLFKLVPANGWILANGDDPHCPVAEDVPWTRVVRVGLDDANDLVIRDFSEGDSGSAFTLVWRGRTWRTVRWNHGGVHNARNAAMAALAAAMALHPEDPTRFALDSLSGFAGVRRRLDLRARSACISVFEDFGHHPTAVRHTLRSLRNRFPGAEICAVLEPRSNTMRRRCLQESLIEALAGADRALLGAVDRGESLAAAERLDTAAVAAELTERGRDGRAFRRNEEILAELARTEPEPGGRRRIVVFFTNGAFGGIIGRYASSVAGASARREAVR